MLFEGAESQIPNLPVAGEDERSVSVHRKDTEHKLCTDQDLLYGFPFCLPMRFSARQ
jgi:hypothetical protein